MTITDLLRKFNVPFKESGHEHCRPGWIQLDCPVCSKDSKHWRLGYNIHGRYFSCWSCGYLRLTETLTALTSQPFRVIRELVQDLPRTRQERAPKTGKLVLPHGIGDLQECHRTYLEERGYDVDTLIRIWNLQGIGLASKLAWRIFIPFYFEGEVVSWLTRGITDDQRHWSAGEDEEALSHKNLLYGEDHCRHAIAIVEGATDVWALGPGAAGTSGTGLKRAQILRMAKYPIRVVCLDNEPIAQMRARVLCHELKVFPGSTVNVTFTYKDASETMKKSPSEIAEFRRTFLE